MDAARMAAGQRFDRMMAGGYLARSDGSYAPKPPRTADRTKRSPSGGGTVFSRRNPSSSAP